MKNFIFQDINKTNHYTNVVLVEKINMAQMGACTEAKRICEECSDFLNGCYQQVRENGFLCVNEDDYYDIATSNFMMT